MMPNESNRSAIYCALIMAPAPFDREAAAQDPFYAAEHADAIEAEALERECIPALRQIHEGDYQ